VFLVSEFTYDLSVKVEPTDQGRRGELIVILANVSEASEPVKSVVFTVPEYGIFQIFQELGEGRYRLQFKIPYEAPAGNYMTRFQATSVSGTKGTVVSIPYKVQ
jgi:hypothetical protein